MHRIKNLICITVGLNRYIPGVHACIHVCTRISLCVFVCVHVYVRHRDLLHTATAQEQEWSRGVDGCGGQRARTQTPVSSAGEDRAILLGFTMMAFSVLMFFVVGNTMVRPFVNRYIVGC